MMLNKIKCIALLMLMSFVGFGQSFPTEKSENHVQIKGTNIFMIPPVGFELSNEFDGFVGTLSESALIGLLVAIPEPFSEVSGGFNSEMLDVLDLELKSKNAIKVADFDGVFMEFDQRSNGIVNSNYYLIYGDKTSTTLIFGTCLKGSFVLEKRIKTSMLSLFLSDS